MNQRINQVKGFVRAEIYLWGYIFEPLNEKQTKVTLINHVRDFNMLQHTKQKKNKKTKTKQKNKKQNKKQKTKNKKQKQKHNDNE